MPVHFSFPATPKASHPQAPLAGERITAMTQTFDSAAPGMAENPMWQAINQGLGGELDVSYVPSGDYQAKFATTIAGGSLPDLVTIIPPVQQLPALLRSTFADLTPYLAGDAVLAHPNLAAIPTDAWRKCIVDGALWAVPVVRPPVGSTLFVRRDLIEKAGFSMTPKDFAEFKELTLALTDKSQKRWASADIEGVFAFLATTRGIGGSWIEEGGRFTSSFERPEYEALINDAKQLFDAGVIHPDGTSSTNNQRNDWFIHGSAPMVYAGFVGWSKFVLWGVDQPEYRMDAMLPFAAEAGITPVHSRGNVASSLTAVKKGDEASVRRLLSVLDWLAAPFGSLEYQIKTYGVEGVSFTRQGTDPVLTEVGQNLRKVPFGYLADAGPVIYEPGARDVAQARFDYQEKALPMIPADPTAGLYSETDTGRSAKIGAAISDARREILLGRQPLSTWSAAVATWKKQGGDAIRAEYETAFAGAHG